MNHPDDEYIVIIGANGIEEGVKALARAVEISKTLTVIDLSKSLDMPSGCRMYREYR